MKQTINNNQPPEEAIQLLPWYATGWLTPKERVYVQDMLEKYPELKNELELEQEIIQKIKEDESLLDLSLLEPAEKRVEKVLDQLIDYENENELVTTSTEPASGGFKQFIYQLFSNNTTQLQYMGIAVITVLSVGLLYTFVSPLVKLESTFQPATTNDKQSNTTANATILLLGLNTDPNDSRFKKLLQGIGAKISVVSGKDGMYRMHLSKKLNPDEVKALIQKLTINKELVWFAGEAY